MTGQLEVSLDVPNLGRAIGFYSALLGATPSATARRTAWFDIPDSTLRIELREASTPSATRLRLCTESRHLRALSARLSETGVVIAEAGLSQGGGPRAIRFSDPGHNGWELCTAIGAAPRLTQPGVPAGRLWRSFAGFIRRLVSPGPVEAAFRREHTREERLFLRHGGRF